MNCNHTQNLLSAYIDHELNFEERRELRLHLLNCAECYRQYEELAFFKNNLENLTPAEMTFDVLGNLKARIQTEERSIWHQVNHLFWPRHISLVFVCLTVFVISSFLLFPTRKANLPNFATQTDSWDLGQASFDQNLTIDQPVTVFHVSSVFP